ncbi:MAG TPA: succinylglutamate desuccinylase/aspartoacylase family protein [Candidatus Limnocylindrales bacterium]|nr:succinylglutamate desuccinylase/aspartoacylase family protein [Candidatus Limnocylindrales bacterium]
MEEFTPTLPHAHTPTTMSHGQMIKTQVYTDIDYDKEGKQQGYLRIPHSRDSSGWGNLFIPITVIKNGRGPTALIVAGNHGDEFEGQVCIMKLARSLRPEEVNGRIILIPALNFPAAKAGKRLSPVDGKNMNRSFPGERQGTMTSLIAHYVTHFLLPISDIILDLHSGGYSMQFIPCALMHKVENPDQYKKMLEALLVFNAPIGFLMREVAGEGLLNEEAEKMGKIVIGTELAGSGQVSPTALKIAEVGTRNVLIHFGLLNGEIATRESQGLPPTRLVESPNREDYVMSPADGIYESFYELGTEVKKGQPIGQVHFLDRVDWEPEEVRAESDGLMICRRGPGLVERGDCVAVMARDVKNSGSWIKE